MIDYQVNFAQESGVDSTFVEYAAGVTSTSIVVTGLTPGMTYSFMVKARNIIGYSAYSSSVLVKAA